MLWLVSRSATSCNWRLNLDATNRNSSLVLEQEADNIERRQAAKEKLLVAKDNPNSSRRTSKSSRLFVTRLC